MMNKKAFGIDKNESVLTTFFTNDWQHSILANIHAPSSYRSRAAWLIGGQMVTSAAAVMYTQFCDNTMLSIPAIMALLYSVMALSNATKNQRDAFSRFMQSYSSKLTTAGGYALVAYCEQGLPAMLFAAFALLMTMDGLTGLEVLYRTHAFEEAHGAVVEELIDSDQEEREKNESDDDQIKEAKPDTYNNRLPEGMKDITVFNKGWKFNMFNVENQIWKQIMAVAVIFATMQFALCGLLFSDNEAFSLLTLVYSMIALFSFFNMSYVRDFDALQVNATPIIMSTMGAYSLMTQGANYSSLGMTLSLVMDSYFGLRYRDHSDVIEFNALELFARQSWTAQAFDRQDATGFQISSIAMIFGQIGLALGGTMLGEGYSALVLAFYLARLVQFFDSTVLGVQMFQSNMGAVILTLLGVTQLGSGGFQALSTLLLAIDSLVGLEMFRHNNPQAIQEYLSVRIPGMRNLQALKDMGQELDVTSSNREHNPFRRDRDDDDFEQI